MSYSIVTTNDVQTAIRVHCLQPGYTCYDQSNHSTVQAVDVVSYAPCASEECLSYVQIATDSSPPPPPPSYQFTPQKNCHPDAGAEYVDGTFFYNTSLQGCKSKCDNDPSCGGITRQQGSGTQDCWLLKDVDLGRCESFGVYDNYRKV